MKRQLLIVLFVVSLTVLGCTTVNQNFVKSVDGHTKTILPEYKEYVQSDPNISQNSKSIRIQSAEKLQLLVDEAKEK